MRHLFSFLLAVTLLVAPALPAHAFRLVPIEMELEPSGRGATQIFRVENDNKEPVAIEVKVVPRIMGMDGLDQESEQDTENFVVFPEQIILQPGENQSIRVQWVGSASPDRELPFRLIAEQLPIDIGKPAPQGGQVRLLVKYVASLYVVPPGVQPAVTVVSAQHRTLEEGPALEVVLRNDGKARQVLREPTLTVQAGSSTLTLTRDQLGGLAGENLLAGTTRRFLVPWPAALPAGPVTAKLALL